MKYIKFLAQKARCYSMTTILRLELESLVMGVAAIVPTFAGVLLRAVASKLFFKQINGFPWIQPRVTIIHTERIICGTHLGINCGTYINGVGGIQFGDNVLIGNNVTISSGEHPIDGASPQFLSAQRYPKKL